MLLIRKPICKINLYLKEFSWLVQKFQIFFDDFINERRHIKTFLMLQISAICTQFSQKPD